MAVIYDAVSYDKMVLYYWYPPPPPCRFPSIRVKNEQKKKQKKENLKSRHIAEPVYSLPDKDKKRQNNNNNDFNDAGVGQMDDVKANVDFYDDVVKKKTSLSVSSLDGVVATSQKLNPFKMSSCCGDFIF